MTTAREDLAKETFYRLSRLDYGLARGGMSVQRRQAIWAALDEGPVVKLVLGDSTDSRVRAGLSQDLSVCRALRNQAASDPDSWIAGSIYEALLAFFFLCVDSDEFVFRGHLNAAWRLVPSFYRMKPPVSAMLQARAVYGAYRWVEERVGRLSLNAIEAEAAAQHYGAGTTLLDVTESMRTAAYFATTPLRGSDKQAELGALYVLSVEDLALAGRSVIRGRDMPLALGRVHATKGAFISGWGYKHSDASGVVSSASDIVTSMNDEVLRSATILDEAGLGIELALLSHQMRESSLIRFRQTGTRFEDPAWEVTREAFGSATRWALATADDAVART
jgi:hypothetical protein